MVELQQSQLAYQERMASGKLVWPDIAPEARIAWNDQEILLDCTTFFISTTDQWLGALLNSRATWFFWRTLTPDIRGGFARLKAQFVEQTPIPTLDLMTKRFLAEKLIACSASSGTRLKLIAAVGRRILDLAPPERRKLNAKLEAWHALDFAALRAEIKKVFGVDIPLKERGEWEAYLTENAAEVRALTARIEAAEREIDAIVYRLFDLTPDEIAQLETSLEGQY